MNIMRHNSLSPINFNEWNWQNIFDELIDQLSIFDIKPIKMSEHFLYNKALTKYQKLSIEVELSTWSCSFEKIKQARIACINGGKSFAVFNLVIHPSNDFDLPFFGADFVTLPNGHLIALDLQPALKLDNLHTSNYLPKLMPIYKKWQSLLPFGGDIPKDAEPFFSPGFLWSRLPLNSQSDLTINSILLPAFKDYLSLYLVLLKNATNNSEERSKKILEGQKSYLDYRLKKDPARGMLSRIFGKDWTEEYISKVLFKI